MLIITHTQRDRDGRQLYETFRSSIDGVTVTVHELPEENGRDDDSDDDADDGDGDGRFAEATGFRGVGRLTQREHCDTGTT